MSVLVLGGAGYIGSHTVYELVDNGYDVIVADNLSTGHIEAVHEKAKFYRGDIRDRNFLNSIFDNENIEGVIHFAAYSLVGESMQEPMKYYDNNLYGTIVLLECMERYGVKNIVFSSTAAVYGEPENIPILESDAANPTNTYGETKLSMEKMMKWQSQAKGLNFVALRYFNACGAHASGKIGEDHSPETHLIPIILQVPNKKREFITVFGSDYDTHDGTCIRDYVHVTDLARAHILAFEYLLNGGKSDVFNLGSGFGFSVSEIAAAARKATGFDIPSKTGPRRAGDPAKLVASSEKAKTVLGWKPEFDNIDTIIKTAWQWHKCHPEGYAEVKY
ncbi:UDP-glucose 4-epimerase GalE [Lachnospiraceae bacterium NSJ-143]|nr:UDP-glucose 4-epimerase GalE [Lachnospiraceae bacterium NSJ-143]